MVDAVGVTIGQRLIAQLGRAVAERITGGAANTNPLIVPLPEPPVGPPPVFPDPDPPPPPPSPPPPPPDIPPPPVQPPPFGPAFPPPPPPPPPPFVPPIPVPAPGPMFPPPPPPPPPVFPPLPPPVFPPVFPPHPGFPGFEPGERQPGLMPGEVEPGLFEPGEVGLVSGVVPGELEIPVRYALLVGVLDADELAVVHAWAQDHRTEFVDETVVIPSDVGPSGEPTGVDRTVRVLDDLGDLSARVAARIRERLAAEYPDLRLSDSVTLRLVEAGPGRVFDVRPPAPAGGVGVVLFLAVGGGRLLLRIHTGRQIAGVTVAAEGWVLVEASPNAAVVFPAELTAELESAGDASAAGGPGRVHRPGAGSERGRRGISGRDHRSPGSLMVRGSWYPDLSVDIVEPARYACVLR